MQSYMVETVKRITVKEPVVPKNIRMPEGKVDAYIVETGKTESVRLIKSEDSGLIDAMEIDGISDVINKETEQLLDMEYGE